MRHLVLDGHNIILNDLRLKSIFSSDAAQALNTLITGCQRLVQGKNKKCSIFFDGSPPDRIISTGGNVRVYFSYEKPADTLIKSFIARSQNPRNLIVASDDLEIQRFARAHSCKIETTGQFLRDTLRSGMNEDSEKPIRDDLSVEEWVRLFTENN